MSSAHPKPESLARLALEGLAPAEMQLHVGQCSLCQAKVDGFRASVSALRNDAPPPEDELARRRAIADAMSAAAAAAPAPAPLRSSRRPWVMAAAVVVAAAAAAVILPRFVTSAPEGWTLEAGQLAAEDGSLEPGQLLPGGKVVTAAGEDVKIRFVDDSRVAATDGTRFAIEATAPEIDLQDGKLEIVATPRTDGPALRVITKEAVVSVVGTRFSVTRAGDETAVSVAEGVVEVTNRADGKQQQLGFGEMLKVRGVVLEPEPSAVPSTTASASASAAAPPVPRASIASIRAQIAAGNFSEASKLISRARAQGGVSQAELAIVEAEALLAQGKGGQAAQAYLQVAESFPSSPQAEEALFAAAQLSLGRSGKGKRGLQLLRQYRARYPSGRFSGEAKRLLEAADDGAKKKKKK
jgi:ferric-dicitrate binding protein FerR (iron transport regulator)